jgi:hypothetical protein
MFCPIKNASRIMSNSDRERHTQSSSLSDKLIGKELKMMLNVHISHHNSNLNKTWCKPTIFSPHDFLTLSDKDISMKETINVQTQHS